MIFSPLGVCVGCLIIFFFKKKIKYLYLVTLTLLIFSSSIISSSLWKFLEHPYKRLDLNAIKNVYGIVVLSGGGFHLPPGNSNIFEWNDPDRFNAGVDLYKSGKAKKLIFTGGSSPLIANTYLEGDLYTEQAILMGIPEKDILSTDRVFNTFQEAKAIKNILSMKKENYREIILVTSAYHMKRAKKIFEREGFIVSPYPVDFFSSKNFISIFSNPINWIPNARSFSRSSSAIREFIGQISYRVWK